MDIILDKKKQREEEILELIKNGKTQAEIAEIKGVLFTTISKWVSKIDPQKVEEAKNEAKQKRDKEILELKRDGKKQAEIAEIMGVSSATISKWISQIDPQKVKEVEDEAKQKRNEKILELKRNGKKQAEIAEIMGVSSATISKWINETKQREGKAKGIRIKLNYTEIKQKLKDHTITQDEIEEYRNYLDDKYDKIELKEVILMSNIYIKTKRTNEAIIFLTVLIENEEMEYLGKERLIEARNATQRIGRIQKAKVLIRENKTTAEIIEKTGLEETEIIRIKNQMQEDIEK